MSETPFMPKATAVWLVENTKISFKQIADFCNLHELEVKGIADGDVAKGIKAYNPILAGQLTRDEIEASSKDVNRSLILNKKNLDISDQKRNQKYVPLSKRQDKPAAIAWLVKFHPEITDGQISRLIGTTKNTIKAIRERTHWNINNLTPTDPVMLGLCKQIELQKILDKIPSKKPTEIQQNMDSEADIGVMEPSKSLFSESPDKEH